jgi:ribosomal protein S18 acetylase RimI-like enzyme
VAALAHSIWMRMTNKPPFRIRLALPSDLPTVRTLLTETWHDTYDPIYGHAEVAETSARWHSIATLSLQISLAGWVFLVVQNGEARLVATALASPSDIYFGDVDLRRLYVHPSAQRQGIGEALLNELIARYPAATAMRLEVEPRNTKAIAFYRKHKFSVAGHVSHPDSDGNDWRAMLMIRALAQR